MIPNQLKIQPGQQRLSPEQEAEARNWASERIAAQLSTEPVDEPETERLLHQAYVVAGLPPPPRICWVNGPLHLVALAPQPVEANLWVEMTTVVGERVWYSVHGIMGDELKASVSVSVRESAHASVRESVKFHRRSSMDKHLWAAEASVRAYEAAPRLAVYRFFNEYQEPNELQALSHFNERVAGYWLGKRKAILVRRPRVLARDGEGRLHSAMGKCIEYRDGWGFYAWHGVRVPKRVILAPE